MTAIERDYPWYYRIELEPGQFSPGQPRPMIPWLCHFLDNANLRGARCLDIGTQEGVASVIMLRKGAASVTAYDRLSMPERIGSIRKAYAVDFDYVHGMEIRDLKAALPDPKFDVIVFTGVLYHMVDPLVGLAIARSMLRNGGLLFFETSVCMDEAEILKFNARGQFYGGSNYFQVSVGALDYWMRMLRLSILDCSQLGTNDVRRVLTVCRAEGWVDAEPADTWMRKHFIENDFAPYGLRYEELKSGAPPVEYRPTEGCVPRPKTRSIDVWKTLQSRKQFRRDNERTSLRLTDYLSV